MVQPDPQPERFPGGSDDVFLKLSLHHPRSLTKSTWKRHKKTLNLEAQPTPGIIIPVSQLPYFISPEERRKLTNAE